MHYSQQLFSGAALHKKMKFSIKDFFSKFLQFLPDLVTFTEEILNGKLHFLCSSALDGYFWKFKGKEGRQIFFGYLYLQSKCFKMRIKNVY